MTTPRRACLAFELVTGDAVQVALARRVTVVVMDNETHHPLHARVSVDPGGTTLTIVVGQGARASSRRRT